MTVTDKHSQQLWGPPDCQSVGTGDRFGGVKEQICEADHPDYCSEQQSLYVFVESTDVQLANQICSCY